MEKTLVMLLALVMLFSLCACSKSDRQTTDPNNSSQTATNSTETSTGSTEKPTDGTEGTTDTTQAPTDEPTTPPTQAPTDEPTTPPTQEPTETPTTPPTTSPTTCNHSWKDATCITPKTCSKCNATEGSATGHSWKNATCTAPKTCSKCNVTEGNAAGHSWKDATCTTPKTCTKCGNTEGNAVGHKWSDATCTTPKTCKTCGATEGSASHDIYQHKCRNCGYEDELLGSFDVSVNQDGSVYAYIYKTIVENEYALAFYGTGETKDFVTSGAPYYSLYEKIKHIEFGEGITRIGNYTLFSWDGWTIKSLTFPSTLIEIGESAFECVNLQNAEDGLQLPNSLVRICNNAFEDATIGKLVIPDKVEYIGEDAFCGAWITHITFGAGIQQIERSAFSKDNQSTILTSLEKTVYKNGYYVGDENNPYYMLVGVSSNEITSLEIHPNTIMIYDRACMDCIFLKSVTIPDSVRIIGDSAFFGCISLTEVSFGQGVEYLNGYAFYDCSNLETISIGKKLKFIGKCNFCYCYSLSEVCYSGTYQEWTSINCEEGWNYIAFAFDTIEEQHIVLKCLDGDKDLILIRSGGV